MIQYERIVAEGLLKAGETPVISETVLSELETLSAEGRIAMPNIVQDLEVIPDATDVGAQPMIREVLGQLSNATGPLDEVQGLANDAIIGNTAISNGMTLITGDLRFAAAMTEIGFENLLGIF